MRRSIKRRRILYLLVLLAILIAITYSGSRLYVSGPLFNVAQVLSVIVLDPQSGGGSESSGSSNSNSGGGGGGGGGGGSFVPPPPADKNASVDKAHGDINGDGKVSLADFSILAYWFKRPLTEQALSSGVDLNHDGKVTLADFSIMAYYWRR